MKFPILVFVLFVVLAQFSVVQATFIFLDVPDTIKDGLSEVAAAPGAIENNIFCRTTRTSSWHCN